MAKSYPHLIITLPSVLLLLTAILLVSPKCYADQSESDGPDHTTVVSKDSACTCDMPCGLPCLYYSPPPPSALPPPSGMPPPEVLSPPQPSWPWPTPMAPYPAWYKPPPRGEIYGADGGFDFYKPSLAWHRSVSWAQVLVSGGILVLIL